jgi:hypothetical protein
VQLKGACFTKKMGLKLGKPSERRAFGKVAAPACTDAALSSEGRSRRRPQWPHPVRASGIAVACSGQATTLRPHGAAAQVHLVH